MATRNRVSVRVPLTSSVAAELAEMPLGWRSARLSALAAQGLAVPLVEARADSSAAYSVPVDIIDQATAHGSVTTTLRDAAHRGLDLELAELLRKGR
jgi:hypothetical protein